MCFENSSVFPFFNCLILTPVLARSSRALNYSSIKFFVGIQKVKVLENAQQKIYVSMYHVVS